jgi:hypothetical protein
MEYAMAEQGITIVLMLGCITVAIICIIFMLVEITRTLQKNGESLSKIEQHLERIDQKDKD